MAKRNQTLTLLRVSFAIAVIIFFTSLASDFSVKMFYNSTDPYIQIITGLIAILFITLLFMLIFTVMPQLRKALFNMFGLKQEDILSASKEKLIGEGLVNPKSLLYIFIALVVGIVAINLLPPPFSFSDKFNLSLTFALMVFAMIEGLSTCKYG